jgi:hypothetical protein
MTLKICLPSARDISIFIQTVQTLYFVFQCLLLEDKFQNQFYYILVYSRLNRQIAGKFEGHLCIFYNFVFFIIELIGSVKNST